MLALIYYCSCRSNGEPVVLHAMGVGFGYVQMTSKLDFTDVVKAIAKYAFVKSSCPLIISIENHCSQLQQVRCHCSLDDMMCVVIPLFCLLSFDYTLCQERMSAVFAQELGSLLVNVLFFLYCELPNANIATYIVFVYHMHII